MPAHNLHNKPFDEGTRDKLELYREYLREWLPVFINGSAVDDVQVFDFFAGPGFDVEGHPGSPAITCEEIHEAMVKRGEYAQNGCVESYAEKEFFNLTWS